MHIMKIKIDVKIEAEEEPLSFAFDTAKKHATKDIKKIAHHHISDMIKELQPSTEEGGITFVATNYMPETKGRPRKEK